MIRLTTAAGALRAGARVSLSEPELLGLAGFVRPGAVCFDVGAAYGMYTFPLARLAGQTGQVHSFEPLPVPYRILEAGRRAVGARNVQVTNAALGSSAGWQWLNLPYRFGLPIHGWAHLQEGLKHPGRFAATRTLEVPVYTVDLVCELREVSRVDFMKLDVEGFEPEVLKGAERTIERHRPALLMEIEDRHLGKYGRTSADVAGWLAERGYRMHVWRGRRWCRTDAVSTARRNHLFTVDRAAPRSSGARMLRSP
ncbi:FkbM family methyltransferase [Nonomuraea diastatica]|uniref:FkbM family methyltransferase n=1 Tax=Nonomuraea diastatica TaxID=1848329 RepID=A0A4R4X2P2_9ACTN|nr:FkbM family methyltransferase [Nonomuraea diastatica]TDD24494.1 FkbM family methyltransferase [Nonomuraea diastatica]